MTSFGIFSPSKGSHGVLFKFVFVSYHRKPGTEACQTSKILSILRGVRLNLATEKSNGERRSGKRSHRSCQSRVSEDGVSLSASKTAISRWGLVKQLGKARQGDASLKSVPRLPAPPPGHRCRTTAWEQQGCRLRFYTSLLLLNKKLSRS